MCLSVSTYADFHYQTTPRIGYTTNYGNGFYRDATYGYPVDYTIKYSSTYGTQPPEDSGGSRHGGLRRVKGYDGSGNEIDTGNDRNGNPDDMWNDAYEYYYWSGHWYRKSGNTWSEWRTYFNWGLIGWDWRSGKPNVDNPTQYYQYNPVPIGDSFIPLTLILFLYSTNIKKKKE